tara:strand:- start:1120 stop:1254 length:135 start_codon:yes stop_codon:yes gene_type:complete
MNKNIMIEEKVRITAVVMVLLLLGKILLPPDKFNLKLKYFFEED